MTFVMATEEDESLGMDIILVCYLKKKFNFSYQSIKKLFLENFCERI